MMHINTVIAVALLLLTPVAVPSLAAPATEYYSPTRQLNGHNPKGVSARRQGPAVPYEIITTVHKPHEVDDATRAMGLLTPPASSKAGSSFYDKILPMVLVEPEESLGGSRVSVQRSMSMPVKSYAARRGRRPSQKEEEEEEEETPRSAMSEKAGLKQLSQLKTASIWSNLKAFKQSIKEKLPKKAPSPADTSIKRASSSRRLTIDELRMRELPSLPPPLPPHKTYPPTYQPKQQQQRNGHGAVYKPNAI